MKLKQSLRSVFRNEEGLYDLSTTDMDKTIEFAKGDFKRFQKGGSPRYDDFDNYQSYGMAANIQPEYAVGAAGTGKTGINYARIPQSTAKKIGYTGPVETLGDRYSSYGAYAKSEEGMLNIKPEYGPFPTPAREPSVWERLKTGAEDLFSRETVEKAIGNILKKHKEKMGKGGAPDPYENMKKFRDSTVRARGSAGAQFRKGQANSPITKDFASAFNPNVSPSLAKFLMANMGTQGVATKGLPSYTSTISVRRPKYTSGAVTPQEVNFRLPTRSA